MSDKIDIRNNEGEMVLMANRPMILNDYVGLERMKKQLRITMGACLKMNEPLPHMLFAGPPGLGKTTIAKIIAEEQGVNFHEIMASNVNSLEDLESILSNLSETQYDIVFIDEIHRLPMRVEELLYPIMEDFIVETEVKDNYGRNRMERFWIPKFTLIGATTLAGDLSQPLRDRFGISFTLEKYSSDETSQIINNISKREYVEVTSGALMDIAKRSKGTARVAINYYNRCKEYANFIGEGVINEEATGEQFELLGIDDMGLDEQDYKVLEYLATQTTPIGIDTIATATNIDKNSIQTIIEPYLVQKRMMDRTRSGRRITPQGLDWIYNHSDNGVELTVNNENYYQDEPAIQHNMSGGMARFGGRR
jgi:Holliday junction DNA helicase RuvB